MIAQQKLKICKECWNPQEQNGDTGKDPEIIIPKIKCKRISLKMSCMLCISSTIINLPLMLLALRRLSWVLERWTYLTRGRKNHQCTICTLVLWEKKAVGLKGASCLRFRKQQQTSGLQTPRSEHDLQAAWTSTWPGLWCHLLPFTETRSRHNYLHPCHSAVRLNLHFYCQTDAPSTSHHFHFEEQWVLSLFLA